jgi:hypothetical protein
MNQLLLQNADGIKGDIYNQQSSADNSSQPRPLGPGVSEIAAKMNQRFYHSGQFKAGVLIGFGSLGTAILPTVIARCCRYVNDDFVAGVVVGGVLVIVLANDLIGSGGLGALLDITDGDFVFDSKTLHLASLSSPGLPLWMK